MRILSQKYFSSRNTAKIAKSLLGKFLVRRYNGKTTAYIIAEVEAYDGFKDKASHAHRGKTERNKIMFGPAGHWYIYFTYGMHYILNIVTGPKDYPAAILIRGVHPVRGRLPQGDHSHSLKARAASNGINGPAHLTKALHIDKRINGLPAIKSSGLWMAAPNKLGRASPNYKNWAGRFKIKSAPRIGVDYAGLVWSKKKYRFFMNCGSSKK